MTVIYRIQDEKVRCFYCHQKIGTAIAVIPHCIAQHPSEKVWLLWPSSSNRRVRYKTLKFRIRGYDVSCKAEKITPVTPVTESHAVAKINKRPYHRNTSSVFQKTKVMKENG